MGSIVVYTDGVCIPNPGLGGWAFYVDDDCFSSGRVESSTNNRMELTAVIKAVESLAGEAVLNEMSLVIKSDSSYVVDGYNSWMHNWAKQKWKVSKKNLDLWKQLYELHTPFIFLEWVRGHSGIYGNEKADEIAAKAIGMTADEISKINWAKPFNSKMHAKGNIGL